VLLGRATPEYAVTAPRGWPEQDVRERVATILWSYAVIPVAVVDDVVTELYEAGLLAQQSTVLKEAA
jgi:hypothetical protein